MLDFFKKFFTKRELPKFKGFDFSGIVERNKKITIIENVLSSFDKDILLLVNDMSKNSDMILTEPAYHNGCTFYYKDYYLNLSKNYISMYKNGALIFAKTYREDIGDFSNYLVHKSLNDLFIESGKE